MGDNFKFLLFYKFAFFVTATCLFTPYNRVIFEKLTCFQLSQEIPRILGNPNVPYRINKYPPPVPILNQLDPVHNLTCYLLKIHLNIILSSSSGSPQWSISLRFHHQKPVHNSLPTRATCSTHLIILDFITHTPWLSRTVH